MRDLSPEDVARFKGDGYLFPRRILSPDTAAVARRRLVALLDDQYPVPGLETFLGYKANLALRWVDDIVHTPRLLDAVASLLGPDLLLWSCSFVIKAPRSPAHYTWHQDATYWGLEPPVALTAWLALGRVDSSNGCMRYVAGFHDAGQLLHEETFAADVMLPRGQQIPNFSTAAKSVDVVLDTGQVSFHDVHTPHASGPNRSNEYRIGCSMVFIPALGAAPRGTRIRDASARSR